MMILRRLVTSALCVAAAVCMRSWGGHVPWQLWLPAGLLLLAGGLVHHQHVGSQLLARAVLWSNLILGVVVGFAGNARELPVAVALAVVTAVALLVLGRRGLDGDARGGSFMPVAFRATLVAILVMALADAQTLLLFGTLFFSESGVEGATGAVSLVLSIALAASIVGLYRLRVWGLMLNGIACVGLAIAAFSGALALPWAFRCAFMGSAALQVLLAAPLVVALVSGARRQQLS